MPIISVIVPVFKVEPYLRRCVDSILVQTFTDFELILVDDGSPDNCPGICDEYALIDARVKVIHKPNGGLSSARNAGLDVATGEYVLFVDSDDYVSSDLLSTAMSSFTANVDRVTFSYYYMDEDTGKSSVLLPKENKVYDISTDSSKQDFFICDLLTYHVCWAAWATIYRRTIIEQYHIRFIDTDKIFAEDVLFILCYTSCCKQIVYISTPLYYYVANRSGSIISKEKYNFKIGRLNELCKCFFDFLQVNQSNECLSGIFSTLFFTFISGYLHDCMMSLRLSRKKLRVKVINDVNDFSFFKHHMMNFSHGRTPIIGVKKWYRRWYAKKEAAYWGKGRLVDLWLLRVYDSLMLIRSRLR